MMFFSGTVDRVIFSDESQPFYIFSMSLDNGGKATCKGAVIGSPPAAGHWLALKGEWIDDMKHGQQVKISQAPALYGGWTNQKVEKALVSNGCGKFTVGKLVKTFGDDFLDAIGDEQLLQEVGGLTQFEAAHLVRTWEKTKLFYDTIPILMDLGFNGSDVARLVAHFGSDCVDQLVEDPWSITEAGFGLGKADQLAQRLGVDMNSPNRIRGVVSTVVRDSCQAGHTHLKLPQVIGEIRLRCPDIPVAIMADAIRDAHVANSVVLDRTLSEKLIYPPDMYKFETEAAEKISELRSAKIKDLCVPSTMRVLGLLPKRWNKKSFAKKVRGMVEQAAEELKFELSEDQRIGIENALMNSVSVFSGLPGTGKTTSLKVLVKVLQGLGFRTSSGKSDPPDVLLLAPTGIAAKRVASLTGVEAFTVHRALGGKPKDSKSRDSSYEGITGDAVKKVGSSKGSWGSWSYGEESRHPAQVVVVDEASMMDIEAFSRVVRAMRDDAHLVLMGDHAQLPSVGAGNVLKDLIDSTIPKVALTEIFRQSETSGIVKAAHAIHSGDSPTIDKDFNLIEVGSEDGALQVILKLVQKLYDREANFQVLSPRHAGTSGVTNLNTELRNLINPSCQGSRQIRVASGHIREGDRVMITANDYTLGIFNGDVGKVSQIDLKRKVVRIKIHGPVSHYVEMDTKTANRLLRLAYAQTIHKSQGQEYDIIVLPILSSFGRQLQRNLIYTAVTRAKQKVFLVGQVQALSRAVQSNKQSSRNSALGQRIDQCD